jgi:hypothetical protein
MFFYSIGRWIFQLFLFIYLVLSGVLEVGAVAAAVREADRVPATSGTDLMKLHFRPKNIFYNFRLKNNKCKFIRLFWTVTMNFKVF